MFLQWSRRPGRGSGQQRVRGDADEDDGRLRAFTNSRCARSQSVAGNPTDDLTSVLVHAEIDGQRLTDDDIVVETLLILIGGDETTRHALSGGTEQLMRHPDQWDALVADADTYSRRRSRRCCAGRRR